MANKNKVLISLIVIFILIIGFLIFFNKSSKTILETYTLNKQGLMKNDKIILDEKFDERGNLIYYKYRLVKIYSDSSTEYTYIQNKMYLDDNNNVYKKETLESNKIDEKEYNSKLKKFEKYYEKENIFVAIVTSKAMFITI